MTEPNLEQELERLLSATRAGTEPDANARARVRAALAVGLAGAGGAKLAVVPRAGLGAKLWLLSALAALVLVGVVLLGLPEKPSPAPARPSAAASLVAAEAAIAPAPSLSAPPSAVPALSASALALPARSASSQPRGPSHAEEPADELALVSSMQLALRSGNASQTLALANEHAQRFPTGALAQEREGARAIARCQLAEPAARASILSAFAARYAGSPYAARVKAACSP